MGQQLRVKSGQAFGLERREDRQEQSGNSEVGDRGAQVELPAAALGAGSRVVVWLQLEMRSGETRQARPSLNGRSFNFPLSEKVLISSLLLKDTFTGTQCLYFSFCRDYTVVVSNCCETNHSL